MVPRSWIAPAAQRQGLGRGDDYVGQALFDSSGRMEKNKQPAGPPNARHTLGENAMIKVSDSAIQKEELSTVKIRAKYRFTEQEKVEIAQRLAHKNLEQREVDEERKSMMSNFKDKIDAIKAEISQLSNNLSTGTDYREFTCTVKMDFKKKVKRFRDVYSHKIVDVRPLDPGDYQMRLNLKPKPRPTAESNPETAKTEESKKA